MYDFPQSPASTHSSLQHSPMAKRRKARRSHSPVPRIATLLPNHHSSQYSPASRAEDISRLLDPAYSSSTSSSPGSSSRAYVDHRGDLHDPDYRDFPIYSGAKTTRKQRRTSASSARSHSVPRADHRHSTYSTRPDWERDWTAEDVDDDDEDDVQTFESMSRFSPFVSEPRTRQIQHYPQSLYLGERTPISSSPVSLGEENALQLVHSPFDEAHAEDEERPRSRLLRKSPSTKKAEASHEKSEHDVEAKAEQSHPSADDDFVPSCTHSLRRQWQAISLRVRFGIFHAKQRLRRSLK
ncbi:hypothetical protein K474DRAFT_1704593 [Panus rudis PR-1116 ss-1]|nr:hypothetical protein K474DRAFT_1704593 [Panus rudis PR-1116 ss-1]